MLNSFLKGVDIQLTLEVKINFGKYNPVVPKNSSRAFFWDTL
jgi:hypothetical protein